MRKPQIRAKLIARSRVYMKNWSRYWIIENFHESSKDNIVRLVVVTNKVIIYCAVFCLLFLHSVTKLLYLAHPHCLIKYKWMFQSVTSTSGPFHTGVREYMASNEGLHMFDRLRKVSRRQNYCRYPSPVARNRYYVDWMETVEPRSRMWAFRPLTVSMATRSIYMGIVTKNL
jgi:hypothetical protein